MTETPSQQKQDQQPAPAGLRTEHLRDYTKLRRTTYDRKIAGVAGGLARHLNIDPIIVRVVFVVLVFFGGAGLVLYGAAWLLVPEDDGSPATFHTSDSTRNTLLIIAGIVAALLVIGDSWGGVGFPWPLFIVLLIVFGYLVSRDGRGKWIGGSNAEQTADAPTEPLPVVPAMQYTGSQYGWQPVAPTERPKKQKKRGPILFGITLALVALGWGILGVYDAGAGHDLVDSAYPCLLYTSDAADE